MRVLVTGATGFLGAHLIRVLSRSHEPIAFARPNSRTDALDRSGVEVRRGTFDDPASLVRAVKNVDAVVHAAGGGIVTRTREYYLNNEESVRALVGALDGIERLVFVSSLAAHGPSTREHPAREEDADRPISHYGKSKRAGERIALRYRERFGVTILRPPALYGPGEHRMVALFRAAQRGMVPMVLPQGTLSLLSGSDCAEAVNAALGCAHPSGIYYVAESRIYARREMAELIGRAVGRERVRVVSVSPSVLRAAGGAMELAGKALKRPVMMSRDKARDATAPDQSCDPSLAMRTFGWQCADDFERGARAAFEDYCARGWLRGSTA